MGNSQPAQRLGQLGRPPTKDHSNMNRKRKIPAPPVTVWSRDQVDADDPKPHDGHVLISIHSPGGQPASSKGYYAMLPLAFDDATEDHAPPPPDPLPKWINESFLRRFGLLKAPPIPRVALMRPSDAKKAVAFVDRYYDRPLHVHCAAGVSRSVGLALVVSKWQRRPLVLRSGVSSTMMANRLVIQLMLDEVFEFEGFGPPPLVTVNRPPPRSWSQDLGRGRRVYLPPTPLATLAPAPIEAPKAALIPQGATPIVQSKPKLLEAPAPSGVTNGKLAMGSPSLFDLLDEEDD